jgi:glycerol-3-phosphate acyltransferase PlsY
VKTALLALAAFLLGSVPTGLIVAQGRGIDPRKTGSGNIGATNVLRAAGKGPAILTLAGDILKGLAAVLLAAVCGEGVLATGFIGLAAVLGHDFSLFLKFKGGKGVATSLGVLALYAPQTGLFTGIIWLMTARLTRYSSLGALVSFGLMPLGIVLFDSREKLPAALGMTALLFLRHRDNISRLVRRAEPKIGGRQ